MKSEDYQDILEDHLLPLFQRFPSAQLILQQDNASIHASRSTKQWLDSKNIEVLDWPARSPDLNPIENLWGILVRSVYANGKQYNTVQELKKAILKAWNEVSTEVLLNLARSMPNRVHQVIEKRGKVTSY